MSSQRADGGMGNSRGPQWRLESLLSEPGNGFCADCGSPDPKWVSLNIGAFICIKCSGLHRSLGVHISKVLSINLDEWTDEQVDALRKMGGNTAVNMKFEAYLPENYIKPKPESPIDERADFIRRKYVLQQFVNSDLEHLSSPLPLSPSSSACSSPSHSESPSEKQHHERLRSRIRELGHAFRNSWRRSDRKMTKKDNSMAGMVEFVGLMNVNIIKGTSLAIRDMLSSDPYVVISLGNQTVKTQVIKRNLNPVWNEKLMLSIPENIPPLKLAVYDKDTFSRDDFMGDAEIDIRPLFSVAKASEESPHSEPMMHFTNGKTTKVDEEHKNSGNAIILTSDGRVTQKMAIELQNVERGELEIELECMLLTQ